MSQPTISATSPVVRAEDITPLWVAVGLALAPAAVMGFGRFAYALLLPAMRADLAWSYADAGTISAGNALGYFVGALIAAPVVRAAGAKRTFLIGVLTSAALLGLTGVTRSFAPMVSLRFLAGVMAAFAFVAGAALTAASSAGPVWRSSMALGIFFVGPGVGIAVSALAVPPVLARWGWGSSWFLLGALSLAAAVLSLPALARSPLPAPAPQGTRPGAWPIRRALPLLIAYGAYGAGYIAYMTFIIAFLRAERQFGEGEITAFWLVVGLSGVGCGFVWALVLAKVPAAWGTVLLTGMLTIGAVLPLTSDSRAVAYLSAIAFGGSFMSVVAAVTTYVRRLVPPHAWASAIGLFTVMFALGQCIGPVLSGAVSDGVHGVRAGLWLSGAILALATVIAGFQRRSA